MSIKCFFGKHDETTWEWLHDVKLTQTMSIGFMNPVIKNGCVGDLGLKFCNNCGKFLDSKRVYRKERNKNE